MLALSGPFPLTSDQPPVAVVDTAALASMMTSGRRGNEAVAASSGPGEATRVGATPRGSESPDPWKLDPARDPFALVGPRPAFEANVLEAERNLDAILARIELARSQAEMRRGTDPDAEAEKARAAAEAKVETEAAPHEDVAALEDAAVEARAQLLAATQAQATEQVETAEAA